MVAAASSFAVMSQLAPQQHAQADTATHAVAHKHDHDHDTAGRERARHDEGARPVRRHADLVVDTKGGPQGAVLPGRTYKWPYEVTNKGSLPAKDVALTATPDRSLKVLAIPPQCNWRRTGRLICRIGLLPQGQTKRGVITASVVPKAVTGRALTSPVQVTWRHAPAAALRTTAFPPARIYPAGKGSIAESAADRVPYPVMQTEHGPVTAEAVVVRSSVAPCANSVIPARSVAGRTRAIKPDCGMLPNTPAPVPAADPTNGKLGAEPCAVEPRHAVTAAGPECASVDRTAGAPCSALPAGTADKPAQDQPAITPCAAAHPGDPCACGASQVTKPASDKAIEDKATEDKAAADKAAADKIAADKVAADQAAADKAAADKVAADKAAADKAAADKTAAGTAASAPDKDQTAAKPSGTSGVVVVPGSPVTLPCSTAVDRPVAAPSRGSVPPCVAAQDPAGRPVVRTDEHATAQRPVTAPCGVVESPGIAQDKPVVPPCAAAQGLPGACSCLASPESHPAAVQGSPVTAAGRPETPVAPVAPVAPCAAVQDRPAGAPCAGAGAAQDPAQTSPENASDATPCGAADKPMAAGDTALPGKSAAPSCASVQGRPVAPDTNVPITPLAGPGKSAHRAHPVRMPSLRGHAPHRAPYHPGRGHKACIRQGSGFICPLGAVPPGHSHMRPALHSRPGGHPMRMRCAGGDSAACHTRMARPVAGHANLTARRLPSTGASSALLALCGLGLAGAGAAFYRVGRGRRSEG